MTGRNNHREQRMPAWLAAFPSAQVRDLDPQRHALIEASAGTGKTFAIEHLVLRLLVENPAWKPEEILLLSFTERTVADLRRRIRTLFRRQLRDGEVAKPPIPGWSEDERARIHDLWLHADDLSVHTLHGFCQSTLLRDPIAHDALLRADVADDYTVADHALEDLLRGAWASDPVRLERLCGALGIGAGENWRKTLISLALGWHPWRDDRLVPDKDDGAADRLTAEAEVALQHLLEAHTAIERGAFSSAAFRATFKPNKTGQEALRRDSYNKVLSRLEEWRLDPPAADQRVESILGFFKSGFTKSSRVIKVKDGWRTELPSEAMTLAEWQTLADACATLRNISEQLPEALRLRDLAFLAEAAMQLRTAFDAAKIRLGRISYDDMPRNLVVALRRGPALAMRIARRYKACIVDEFQDTDPLQWEILQRLCLQGSADANTQTSASSPSAVPALPSLPLFLVGDPKQAIYAFRGGDLPTYLAARATFRELAASGQAQGFGLEANFRSRPALIEGLNAVFARPEWFKEPVGQEDDPAWHLPADSGRVHFSPAQAGRKMEAAPDGNQTAAPCIFLRDFSGITGRDGNSTANKKDVESALRNWIAARIVTLLENNTPASDIAVLVRKNAEGLALERVLRRRGIPCRIRRRSGMFHGPHADALRLLLEWIDDAGDPDAQARILLLPFARAGSAAEQEHDELPRGRPVRCPPLVARWAMLARAGRWPEFFDSVRLESGFQSRLERVSPSDAEQFAALTRRLGEAGSAPGTTTRALRERFDSWRRGDDDTDGGGEPGGATEPTENSVTIMTLHMSKGLEFPIVFLAAAGDMRKPEWYALRDPETPGFRLVLDLKNAEDKALFDLQTHDEELRLFYVAFTRAADALHVPLLPEPQGRRQYGPLGSFAANALRAAASEDATAHLFAFDEAPVHDTILQRMADADTRESDTRKNDEANPESTRLAFARRRMLTSYSRLAHRAEGGGPAAPVAVAPSDPLLEDDGTRAQRQETVPEAGHGEDDTTPEDVSVITAAELPPGAGAGTALHALLEHTPFESARMTDSPEAWLQLPGQRTRVEDILRRESVDPACAPAAARAVWNALRSAIPDPAAPDTTIRLADLEPDNLRHEVEFLLPFGPGSGTGPIGEAVTQLPEGIVWKRAGSEVFLWGFIDLVFRHEGRYYLLDWKSNLLPAYDRATVERSMAQHRYDLQWKLYSVALDRWLSARLQDYRPEQHFGGVCYLYLRGASEQGAFSGFTDRPSREELRNTYPEELAALLHRTAEETP